jgi:hypothetical protein
MCFVCVCVGASACVIESGPAGTQVKEAKSAKLAANKLPAGRKKQVCDDGAAFHGQHL